VLCTFVDARSAEHDNEMHVRGSSSLAGPASGGNPVQAGPRIRGTPFAEFLSDFFSFSCEAVQGCPFTFSLNPIARTQYPMANRRIAPAMADVDLHAT